MQRLILILFWILIINPFRSFAQNITEVDKLVESDRGTDERFGNSVCISDGYAIIGAIYDPEDENGENILIGGSAYIFKKQTDGGWVQYQKIIASDKGYPSLFGGSVSISGNYAIVGDEQEDMDENGENPISWAGAVYIFENNQEDQWEEVNKIISPDRSAGDKFGISVSISGNYAIIGAAGESEDIDRLNTLAASGAVYVCKKDAAGWNVYQKLVASDREEYAWFGSTLCIDGNYAAVGAYNESKDESGNNPLFGAGAVYIFKKDESDNWNEVQKIVASDRNNNDEFGKYVYISDDYIIAGAPEEDQDEQGINTLPGAGSVYIFKRDESELWTEVQKIVPSDRDTNDHFGYSVSISNGAAIVGSPYKTIIENGNTYEEAGSAYIYKKNNEGKWEEKDILTSTEIDTGDWFGSTVSISKNHTLIGAMFDDEDAEEQNYILDAGAAYMYEFCYDISEPDPDNIIINGDFGSCYFYPWYGYIANDQGVSANFTLVDGECIIDNIQLPDDPLYWHVQLIQSFNEQQIDRLEINAIYHLSFDVYSDTENRHCLVYFGQDESPWASQLIKEEYMSAGMQTLSFDFTLTDVYPSMRLALEFGQSASAVKIDNVKLVKTGYSDISNTANLSNIIYPNPTSDILNIHADPGSKIFICDISGKIVKTATTVGQEFHLDLSDLNAGIYIVKISKENVLLFQKLVKQ